MNLIDSYNRPALNLRISVTQRCNLDCVYCHREGEEKNSDNNDTMSEKEIVKIAEIAVSLGISRIKLTGGEPLLRENLWRIIGKIYALPNIKDISMTTNGMQLKFLAKKLYRAGLKRVNISLPTLNANRYKKLTGGTLEKTLEGIKTAVDTGFFPVKLNMVLLKGVNTNEVQEMIKFSQESQTILQLIELDPINVKYDFYSTHHNKLDGYEAILQKKALRVKTRRMMQNRKIYSLPNSTVEVVKPIENGDFCMHCTRLRITSFGMLKPCLMRNDNLVDILSPIRQGATDEELKELFIKVNYRREPYNKSCLVKNEALNQVNM